HLTLAIGCTGGQHRSVALVERLAQDLQPWVAAPPGQGLPHLNVQVHHRHLLDSQREMEARFGPLTGRVSVAQQQVRIPDDSSTLAGTAAVPVIPHG
ncbi:RapZ C-terminal domain-containing protein, partial [Thermostichus vulcanus]